MIKAGADPHLDMNMRRILVLLAVMCVCGWVCPLMVCRDLTFGPLCEGNLNNSIRTSDGFGQGHYGADRGGRLHAGVDVVCEDGSAVYAPFDVTITRVFEDQTNSKTVTNQGLELRGEGLCFQLFSVRPDQQTGCVLRGQRLGTMLPMQTVYPGITSHVHVQMCNSSIDPTQYF